MDFLDPRKRRAYNIRLLVGYVLVAVVIILATVILVYGANGYGINTKTGQIVQNGLLFTDSHPGGATIYLNGKDKNANTPSRLILPAGKYTLTLKRAGYRDWSRQFTLSEQSVARYVYPFLFPQKPVITDLKSYATTPPLVTETPNQHWLLVQSSDSAAKAPIFDQFDTTTLDDKTPVVTPVSLPEGVLTDYSSSSVLTAVEWSTDNNNLLLKHTSANGSEFVVFNRAHPDQSFNVNQLFNTDPTEVNFYNKKADQLYLFNQADGSLRLGDISAKQLAQPILSNALAYKPYGTDLLTYVTAQGEPAGKAMAKIWDDGKSYNLYEFSAGTHYLINAAQFQGHFYYIAGSDTTDRVNIYKDPLNDIKNPSVGKALPILALNDPGATEADFSDNARFVGIENLQRFAVYDFETKNAYEYSINQPLQTNMNWMDGHRYIGQSNGQVFVMDYDGTNQQSINPTVMPVGALFSADYNHMLTIAKSPDGKLVLEDIDMRAGADLPKR
ncbi:MAG TPA: PEGA domain-containing protein [Candidatus Saccharimonadales bacterium]|nr:PEGA domain-containing protein [Candidatus Saccharimonadales bacterium]